MEWTGPACPECGQELNAVPLSTTDSVDLAFSCPAHGLISILDPFDDRDVNS